MPIQRSAFTAGDGNETGTIQLNGATSITIGNMLGIPMLIDAADIIPPSWRRTFALDPNQGYLSWAVLKPMRDTTRQVSVRPRSCPYELDSPGTDSPIFPSPMPNLIGFVLSGSYYYPMDALLQLVNAPKTVSGSIVGVSVLARGFTTGGWLVQGTYNSLTSSDLAAPPKPAGYDDQGLTTVPCDLQLPPFNGFFYSDVPGYDGLKVVSQQDGATLDVITFLGFY